MTNCDPRQVYEDGSYFEKGKAVFTDLNSSFQKYRIKKVSDIYTPSKNDTILDLGCGWGTFCFAMSTRCRQITGVDFSFKAIELCNETLKCSGHKNVSFVLADAKNTGLGSGCYDVIICADLLEHLYPDDSAKVLDECHRLLKDSGKLLIWTPHRGHFLEIMKSRDFILKKDLSHVDFKSMDYLLAELRKRKFKALKAYYTESHIPILRNIERAFLGILPCLRRRIAILAQKDENI